MSKLRNDLILSDHERRRIHVVGTSGSGKSTLARELASRLNFPYVELDTLHWLPNWKEENPGRFRDKLRELIKQNHWVSDGNYFSKSVDIQWAEQGGATTVVWCDYSFAVTLGRAIKRAFRRAWTQEEVWPGTGNRESFRKSFFSHDSVVVWTMVSYRVNKRRYSEIISSKKYPHLRFVRIRNDRDCRLFLSQF